MKSITVLTGNILTLAVVLALPLSATGTSAFETWLQDYEAIRLSLFNDEVEGVADRAEQIVASIDRLSGDFSPAAAGIDPSRSEEIGALLPEIRQRALELANARDLNAARNAFSELTKPLVRYREAAVAASPVVVYCSMARKAWLQEEGEIGNPYYGQSMAKCGEVVSD